MSLKKLFFIVQKSRCRKLKTTLQNSGSKAENECIIYASFLEFRKHIIPEISIIYSLKYLTQYR